jgi:hypothetical protein
MMKSTVALGVKCLGIRVQFSDVTMARSQFSDVTMARSQDSGAFLL